MKLLIVIGARPQFIKAATVSRAIREHHADGHAENIVEVIVHTGQHFDANMSAVFFEQLDIPAPHHNLGIAGLSHGAMTGRMLEEIEALVQEEVPDWVLVFGDTNSTLAAALAAAKLHVPVAHVEAGLRSNNPAMPEEVNRVLTDRVATMLLCPTAAAVENLHREGFPFPSPQRRSQIIENVGDVMYDAVLHYREMAHASVELGSWGIEPQGFALCTLHRQENTDDPVRLENILAALRSIAADLTVVLPLHPRTRKMLESRDRADWLNGLRVIDPVPYLEMQSLQMGAKVILTDSGGVQKEAYFHGVPCITLRDETEWVETVDAGWNCLAGADKKTIVDAYLRAKAPDLRRTSLYGDGHASGRIVELLLNP